MRRFVAILLDALLDPLRRRNLMARVAETIVPATLVLGLFTWWAPAWAAAIALGEFLLYEYWLEPRGWAGHYWERGPRTGERFTRP